MTCVLYVKVLRLFEQHIEAYHRPSAISLVYH